MLITLSPEREAAGSAAGCIGGIRFFFRSVQLRAWPGRAYQVGHFASSTSVLCGLRWQGDSKSLALGLTHLGSWFFTCVVLSVPTLQQATEPERHLLQQRHSPPRQCCAHSSAHIASLRQSRALWPPGQRRKWQACSSIDPARFQIPGRYQYLTVGGFA